MSIPAFWSETWTAPLINHLWQSTIVVGVAWLLALALRKNHARVRYWIWFAVSVKFLLPFSLLTAAGEWLRLWVPAPAARPAVTSVVAQVAQPFAQAQFFGATEAPAAAHHADWLPIALLAVWACGALLVAARFARRWWSAYATKRAARPFEISADVPVLCTQISLEPGIFGIFRPVLLLPEGILERLSAEQMRAIVAHEMCHVRRRDNLTYAIHMVVETLFWFHPAVWWIGMRLIHERECACDEAVVQACGKAEVYAESILNVCKFCVESPLACVAGVTGADLKQRIVRIMKKQIGLKLNLSRKALLAAAGAAAVITPIVAGLAAVDHSAAQSPSASAVVEARSPMRAGADPSFEVATIKPSKAYSRPGWGFPVEGRHITCYNATIVDMISIAYGIHAMQIEGGPDWIRQDRFDVDGVADVPGHADLEQQQGMWRKLLADRFQLKLRRDMRELPVYAITVAKGGPKNLTIAQPGEHLNAGNRGAAGERILRFTNMPLSVFAFNLDFYLDRPVIDETGLTGSYDFTLKWTYDDSKTGDSEAPPSLPTALKEQLGLEMKAAKGPAAVFIVDHVEQPSPN